MTQDQDKNQSGDAAPECANCGDTGIGCKTCDMATRADPATPAQQHVALADGQAKGEVPYAVWQERVACARIADAFAHEEGPGERRYSGNVISARILGRTKSRVADPITAPAPGAPAAGDGHPKSPHNICRQIESGLREHIAKLDAEIADLRAALAAQVPAVAVEALRDEGGWLVERDSPAWYLTACCDGRFGWSPIAADALRFSRKQDGEAICRIVKEAERVCFHVWDATQPAASAPVSEKGGADHG